MLKDDERGLCSNIANTFTIQHLNEKQKGNYDRRSVRRSRVLLVSWPGRKSHMRHVDRGSVRLALAASRAGIVVSGGVLHVFQPHPCLLGRRFSR